MYQIQCIHKPTGEVVFFSAENRSAIQSGLSYLGEPLTILKIRRISKRRMKRKCKLRCKDGFAFQIERDPETGNWREQEFLRYPDGTVLEIPTELRWWEFKRFKRTNFVGCFCGFYK